MRSRTARREPDRMFLLFAGSPGPVTPGNTAAPAICMHDHRLGVTEEIDT